MAAAFVKFRFAPFAVGYEDDADPTMPYIDDTMTIDPPPASRIRGIACFAP